MQYTSNVNMAAEIQVIIVNYNSGETITRCLQSVLSGAEKVNITVVDNASDDGSIRQLQSLFGRLENIQIVCNEQNIGFSRAVNAAAGMGNEEFLLILNPDCELFSGALGHLKQALEHDPLAVLSGPMVVDRTGVVQKSTLRSFPDPWNSLVTLSGFWRLGRWFPVFKGVNRHETGLPDGTTTAEAVSGACMLVRRKAFDSIGRMDEGYGLHCEDLDLMYRLQQQGNHCVFVPAARVFHQQGVSSRSRPLWVHRQKHLGMQRFFRKFQAERYPLPFRWLVIAGIWLRYALTLPLVLIRN
jgi:GT2 family glycosyltransferase